jgi:predicted nucleic acid-binding protein
VQLFASASTLAELERVLNYKNLALSPAQQQTHFAYYQSQVQAIACPDNLPHLPLCRDPDDQKFLALAATCQVTALLSKDKRLLELDRPSMRRRYHLGFKICLPEAWHYPQTMDNPKGKPGDFPA